MWKVRAQSTTEVHEGREKMDQISITIRFVDIDSLTTGTVMKTLKMTRKFNFSKDNTLDMNSWIEVSTQSSGDKGSLNRPRFLGVFLCGGKKFGTPDLSRPATTKKCFEKK